MAETGKLVFNSESELLEHPAVLRAIDEKVTAIEQDAYATIDKIKETLIRQAISIGIETDSFLTRRLKSLLESGSDEEIKKEYEAIKEKLEKRSFDSLCDTLSDLDEEFMRRMSAGDSIKKKLHDAMQRDVGQSDLESHSEDDNEKDKSESSDNDKKDISEDINNPSGGDSDNESNESNDEDDDPFGRVTRIR